MSPAVNDLSKFSDSTMPTIDVRSSTDWRPWISSSDRQAPRRHSTAFVPKLECPGAVLNAGSGDQNTTFVIQTILEIEFSFILFFVVGFVGEVCV